MDQIRESRKAGFEIGEAVDKAIDDMPMEYAIRMFLMKSDENRIPVHFKEIGVSGEDRKSVV